MILSLLLSTVFFSPPLLASSLPESTSISFEAPEELVLTKTFTTSLQLEVVELTSTMGGQEVPPQYLPDMSMQIEEATEVVVRDEYLAVSGGRPTHLRREYETLSGNGIWEVEVPPAEAESGEWEASCDLEGETVEFRWDEERGEYTPEQQDAEKPSEHLEALDADLDLLAFLPEKEVEEGDRWEVKEDAITCLLDPGGELGLTQDPDDEEMTQLEDVSVEGKVKARLTQIREKDGRRVAVIALEGEYVHEEERPTDLRHVPVSDGTAREYRTSRLSLEGELLWDLTAGHGVSLELTAEVDLFTELVRDPDQPGPTFTSTLTFEGKRKFAVSFEEE